MEAKLKQLVTREDKRNPLTDQQLAEALSGRREDVTLLRKELGIPDSRERRHAQLAADAAVLMGNDPSISARALTARLQDMGYDISRHVAGQLLKELACTESSSLPAREPEAFSNLIGWDGSLRTQIQQAKAAVIYPPSGLHTLILGESGVGKSELAEAMYRYSVDAGQRLESAPYVIFNCADYAENPQLLISQLFGHTRTAFTGAGEDKAGLVEKADGGLLFLDEIHRLPPEGQEILYSLIDRGSYRRLGETDNQRKVDLMLVAATTENPESTLLTPFRRRIPMVIELPPLRGRPLEERKEIILHFFRLEADRVGKTLVVRRDVLKALLIGDKPGNVGQVKSDVQVACARGFLNHFGSQSSDEVLITLNELSNNSHHALLTGKGRQDLEVLFPQDGVFYPGSGEQRVQVLRDNIYSLPDEIYQRIEELVNQGRNHGLSPEETSQWVSQQVEQEFSSIIKRMENIKPSLSRTELEKLIGPELSGTMTEMVELASTYLDVNSEQLFFYLAIHLHTVLDRIRSGKPIVNPQLAQVKTEHEQEYLTAVKMAAVIKRQFGLSLPDDELGFIALYLRTFQRSQPTEGRVAVLVLSHGGIAREMVNVVHALLQVDHAHGLDMALTESPDNFLGRVMAKAREIDQGKGILLLVDMGSLVTFGEAIQRELGIKVQVLDRVDLVMVLEATRWSMLTGAKLDDIANDLAMSKVTPLNYAGANRTRQLIVAVCLSGIGGAEKIRAYLEAHLDCSGLEIKTIGVLDETRLKRKLDEWKKQYALAAIVGTINPEVPKVPFIPFQSVTEPLGISYLKSLLSQHAIIQPKNNGVLTRDLIVTKAPWKDKETIIRSLGEKLMQHGYVKAGFIEGVYEREEAAPTCIEGGIAIPHSDPEFVLRPGIAVATLDRPINWWGMDTDVVFLLALRVSDRQLFADLAAMFRDKQRMGIIRSARTAAAIEEEIHDVTSREFA